MRQDNDRLRRENEALTSRVTHLQQQLLTSQATGEELREKMREERERGEKERKASTQVRKVEVISGCKQAVTNAEALHNITYYMYLYMYRTRLCKPPL